ncbi:unnamed protein product [Linum tenue]|uniref:Sulfotransferase n=1 Tax=Linum tenue TaxID=586396 RepID=A0AAV0PK27_9ROSI|nr:unnamed protein product [Linum tenue]
MKPMAAFRSQFECRNDDVFLASFPKTGTTWLKALCHTILHRHDQEEEEEEEDILTKKNPHQVVPTLEFSFLLGRVQHLLLSPRRRPALGRESGGELLQRGHALGPVLRTRAGILGRKQEAAR